MFRVQEAIDLHNARRRKKNNDEGKPENDKTTNLSRVGMILYPNAPSYESVQISMNYLKKGIRKKVDIDWIPTLSKELGVDPNFIFGLPSKHDKDFERLVLSQLSDDELMKRYGTPRD